MGIARGEQTDGQMDIIYSSPLCPAGNWPIGADAQKGGSQNTFVDSFIKCRISLWQKIAKK